MPTHILLEKLQPNLTFMLINQGYHISDALAASILLLDQQNLKVCIQFMIFNENKNTAYDIHI